MGSILLIFIALFGAVTAQQSFGEFCDSKVMNRWESCNGSDYSGLRSIIEKCNATCEKVPVSKTKPDTRGCCAWNCIVFNFSIVDDGMINKTALTSLFGEIGDPKIMENIGECEAIVAKNSSISEHCGIPKKFLATMFCTSWLNLAKNGNVSDIASCTTLSKFSSKCFDFYKEAAVTPGTERPSSADEDAMIEAVNFMGKPCYKILAELPAAECTKGFIGWLPILSSCSKKCNNDECCLSNCVFQENGLLVEGSLNKTKLASWISRTGNAEDLRVMAYIDHCETIVKKASHGGHLCGTPASVLEVFHCAFWIYGPKETLSKPNSLCYNARKFTEKCFNLKSDTFMSTTKQAEAATAESLTNHEESTSAPSEPETEATQKE